jgi:hypothetical protein
LQPLLDQLSFTAVTPQSPNDTIIALIGSASGGWTYTRILNGNLPYSTPGITCKRNDVTTPKADETEALKKLPISSLVCCA